MQAALASAAYSIDRRWECLLAEDRRVKKIKAAGLCGVLPSEVRGAVGRLRRFF
jgi:hypothetical protein